MKVKLVPLPSNLLIDYGVHRPELDIFVFGSGSRFPSYDSTRATT